MNNALNEPVETGDIKFGFIINGKLVLGKDVTLSNLSINLGLRQRTNAQKTEETSLYNLS